MAPLSVLRLTLRHKLLNVKPAVGFTLPWAGVTPAPSEGKREDAGCALLEQVKGEKRVFCL
jgi:hypothetical protein